MIPAREMILRWGGTAGRNHFLTRLLHLDTLRRPAIVSPPAGTAWRPNVKSRRLVIAVVALLAPACGGIGVREAKRPALFADWRASALAADRPSPRTVQTLRIYDLDHVYDRDPDAAARQLHIVAVADPQPDTLFALAEVHYLRGRTVGKKHPDEALRHYVRCCAYAQHYLLASSVEGPAEPDRHGGEESSLALGLGRKRLFPDAPRRVRPALPPRLRPVQRRPRRVPAAAQKAGRLDARAVPAPARQRRRRRLLPSSTSGSPGSRRSSARSPSARTYEVVGLANQYRDYGLGVPLIGTLAADAGTDHGYYASQLRFPVTAMIRFEGGLADLDRAGRPAGTVQPADDAGGPPRRPRRARWKPT